MGKQAFEGIKIADFAWFIAGPTVSKYLAAHGAEVIRIEYNQRPCILRVCAPYKDEIPGVNRAPYFCIYNENKYGITLNLNQPGAIEVAKRIVAWSDIVLENFGPGIMEKRGLGYEDLRQIKPEIIMISLSNQGQTGPRGWQRGAGVHLTGLSGFYHLTGWPDREPAVPLGIYTDSISPRFATAALIAALDYRRRTGKGQYFDLSQYECATHFLSPIFLDFTVNGRVANRMGNRCPYAAPHGAYPCKGEDKWCVIAVFSDEEWNGFCKALGNPSWTTDPKFATLLRRKANEDELDELVAKWSITLTAEEVMVRMQSEGVSAGVVQTCEDVSQDPQLKHRHHFWELEHPEIGKHNCNGPAFSLSKTPAELWMPAPCLGEHNEYVCTKILGMSDSEFVELLTAGVFD